MKDNHLEYLLPLLKARGVRVSPEEFHAAVNVVFHAHESAVYDKVHVDMKETLLPHFQYLTTAFAASHLTPASLNVLDIGCGTGLSSEFLLQTCLGNRIAHIDLLDTSAEMLKRCGERTSINRISHRLIHGTLDALPAAPAYDVIVACSLLHHVPNLQAFLAQVERLQRPGGVFLHLQDPNGDHLNDPELKERTRHLDNRFSRRLPGWLKRATPRRVAARVVCELTGKKSKSYIDRINDDLLRSGVITSAMTENELWSVTDIHVVNGKGISLKAFEHWMAGYRLLRVRSYSFFGTMYAELPRSFRRKEDRLLRDGALSGQHVGAIWQQMSAPLAL